MLDLSRFDSSCFHTRVEVKDLEAMPAVIILGPDGRPFYHWSAFRRDHNLGYSTARQYAYAIGLLIDFVMAHVMLRRKDKAAGIERPAMTLHAFDTRSEMMGRFADALLFGTIRDFDDPLGLFWPPGSRTRAKGIMHKVSTFGDWLARPVEKGGLGLQGLNPFRTPTIAEQIVFWRLFAFRKKGSLLGHLKVKAREARSDRIHHAIQVRGRPARDSGIPPAFPEERVIDLLTHGFNAERRTTPDWVPLRDRLILLLLHWGGLRVSEPLHLWCYPTPDILVHKDDPTTVLVRIHHPSDGWVAEVPSKTRMRRSKYLRMRWNLPPLTEYPVKSRRVGWKDPLLSSDQQYLDVFWSDLAAGSLFHQLWLEYLMRRPRTDHPWAFISQDLNPMSTTNFQHRHAAACRRIGLLPAKHLGTTPHGHRGDAAADAAVRHHLHEHQHRKHERHTGEGFGPEEADEVGLRHPDERLHHQHDDRRQSEAQHDRCDRAGQNAGRRCPDGRRGRVLRASCLPRRGPARSCVHRLASGAHHGLWGIRHVKRLEVRVTRLQAAGRQREPRTAASKMLASTSWSRRRRPSPWEPMLSARVGRP
jgi:hypothetical protein